MEQTFMLIIFDELIESTKKIEENLIIYHTIK